MTLAAQGIIIGELSEDDKGVGKLGALTDFNTRHHSLELLCARP
jgi:hypothetical protein